MTAGPGSTAGSLVFALHQAQDVYVSLGIAARARERGIATRGIVLNTAVLDELQGREAQLDRIDVVGDCFYPHPLRALLRLPSILRYRRTAHSLSLSPNDVLIAYSFREFALNVLIKALGCRPRLVAVRKSDARGEELLTRRRPFQSLYWNTWNAAFGITRQRYRWLPSTNRIGSGTFVRDPYDETWCLADPAHVRSDRRELPYPFALLRPKSVVDRRPTLVFLGEKYPLWEGQALSEIATLLNESLAALARAYPEHRLIFKPRGAPPPEVSLDGWEVQPEARILEGMLADDASIDTVVSFKSSGSVVGALYGCTGILLYPLCCAPADVRQALDDYFADSRDLVHLVGDLAGLGGLSRPASADPARIRGLVDVFLDATVAPAA